MTEVPRILCRTGRSAGCSACCGLFNFRNISKAALTKFLSSGSLRASDPGFMEDPESFELSAGRVRDRFSHICPYQGFISDESPGCLCHESYAGSDTRDRSLFGAKICGAFLCPAHTVLTDVEKIFLALHAEDWYLYSIGIIDPASTSWIINKIFEICGGGCSKPEIFSAAFNRALAIHSSYLGALNVPVFYYSLSEYNFHRKAFSLDIESGERGAEIEEITEAVKAAAETRSQ